MHSTMMTGFSSKPSPVEAPEEEPTDDNPLTGDPDDVYIAPVAGVGVGSYKLKPKPVEAKPVDPAVDIPELFQKMRPQRELLTAIIDYCREERASEDIDAMLAPLMAHRRSVYTPVIMRDLLLRNGALAYCVSEEPQDAEAEVLREETNASSDESGEEAVPAVQFLEVPEEKPGRWQATPEAIAYIESRAPGVAILGLLDEKPELAPLYRLILEQCAEEPRSTKYLDNLIESHPLAQNPQRFGSYFVGRLEDADALIWEGAWKTAEAARFLTEEDR